MSWPYGLNVVTVTGTFADASGTPLSGTITFTPVALLPGSASPVPVNITDPAGHLLIGQNGAARPVAPAVPPWASQLPPGQSYPPQPISVELVATDNDGLSPSPWYYQVTLVTGGAPPVTFTCSLPSSPSTVDYTALVPVVTAEAMSGYLPGTGGTVTGTLNLDGSPPISLPSGTGGYVLTSDASGNLTLQAPTGGSGGLSGPMTTPGDLIYEDSASPPAPARLGIGSAGQVLTVSSGAPAWEALPAASASAAGVVELAGDLGGTYTSPQVLTTGGLGIADTSSTQAIGGVKTFTGEITVPAPVNPSDAATKAYVDATAQGLQVKPAVNAATVTALPAYTVNSATQITATSDAVLAVDGVSITAGSRVLVKNETGGNAPNNGIWYCTQAGVNDPGGAPYILQRPSDMDTGTQVPGAFTFTEAGSVNADAGFVCTTTGSVTLGTTPIAFTQFSAAGQVTAGTGLTQSGSTISLATPVTIADGGTGTSTGAPQNEVFAGPASGGAGAPSFRSLVAADVPVLNQNTTGTAGNVTGTVAVASGGTGQNTLTAHELLAGNGTSAVTQIPPGTAGQALISGGSSASPSFGTLGVPAGGTGQGSLAAYGLLAGSGTGAVQQVAAPGTAGTVLTSTGATSLPTWQAAAGGGGSAVDWVNAAQAPYSAAGNGTTNDTTAIQDAVSAAAGGVCYLPAGTYLVGNLTLPAGTTLMGDGPGATVLSVASGTTGAVISLASPSAARRTCVRDLMIEGNNVSVTGISLVNTGLSPSTPGQHRLYNVLVQDCGVDAFYYGTALVETFTAFCTAYNAGRYGFSVTTGATDSRWVSCTTGPSGSHGFVVTGSNNHFSACKAYYAGWNGSAFTSGHGWYVLGTSAYPVMGTTWDGCEAQDCADQGWNFTPNGGSLNNLAMTACVIDSCNAAAGTAGAGAAIATNSVTYSSVTACTAWNRSGGAGTMTYGISVAGTQTGLVISGNGFSCSAGPFWYSSGYGYLLAEPYIFDLTGVSQYVKVPSLVCNPAAAQALSSGSAVTLGTAYGVIPLTATSAVTGITMPGSGLASGQTVTLVNQSAYPVTFAAPSSSHVADGTSDTLAACASAVFTWDGNTSLWYRGRPAGPADWVNAVTMFGADPTGAGDSTAAIQAALNSAAEGTGVPYGMVVYLPAGTYKVSAHLTIPQGVTLQGASGGWAEPGGDYGIGGLPMTGSILSVSSAFTPVSGNGAAVIYLTAGDVQSGQQQIRQISIYGQNAPGGNSIHGIQGYNAVAGVKLRDVLVYGGTSSNLGGNGLDMRPGANQNPDFWDVAHCKFSGMGGYGVNIDGAADCYFTACEATGNTGAGWAITNCGNSRWTGCKGENSGTAQGWLITAASGFAGEVAFTGCTSQFNKEDGWKLSGPGGGLYQFTGCRSAGDGESSGSAFTITGSFAGTALLTGWGSIPSASVPATGLTVSSVSSAAYILASNSVFWGQGTAASNDGSAGAFLAQNVVYRTGVPSSPASSVQGAPGLESYSAAGSSGTALTLNVQAGAVQAVTLTGDVTYTFTSPPAWGAWSFTLIQSQDSTGGRTVTWPSSVQWQDGATPALTANANATDILVFMTPDAGSTWYGSVAGLNFAA